MLCMNLQQYFPVLLFILVATVIGFALLGAGRLLGPHRPYDEKLSQYECGFEAFGDSRMKFDVRYYLVRHPVHHVRSGNRLSVPVGHCNGTLGLVGFWTVIVFLAILTVGFIYEWKKGALDWE